MIFSRGQEITKYKGRFLSLGPICCYNRQQIPPSTPQQHDLSSDFHHLCPRTESQKGWGRTKILNNIDPILPQSEGVRLRCLYRQTNKPTPTFLHLQLPGLYFILCFTLTRRFCCVCNRSLQEEWHLHKRAIDTRLNKLMMLERTGKMQ